VEYLKEYISRERSIESIIGYKNEIKLTPELELLKEGSKPVEESKSDSCASDGPVVVWTQATAKGILLKDIYVLANCKEPLYLYYYWDEVPSPDYGAIHDRYFTSERIKDRMLSTVQLDDFAEMVANIVQNIVGKKKRKKRNRNRKRLLPEQSNKNGIDSHKESKSQDKQEEGVKFVKSSPSSDIVYDSENPFKSLFKRARPQTVDPQSEARKLFDTNNKTSSCIIIEESKEKKPSLLQQSESERSSRGLPIAGSAANSMRIISGVNCSELPLLDLSGMAEIDKAPPTNINPELRREEGEKMEKKAVRQKRTKEREQTKQGDIKLQQQNKAFKMFTKETTKEDKVELNSFC
jgi:hypothetical protein